MLPREGAIKPLVGATAGVAGEGIKMRYPNGVGIRGAGLATAGAAFLIEAYNANNASDTEIHIGKSAEIVREQE